LTRAGVEFEILASHIPEDAHSSNESPEAYATRLAREKALAVARSIEAQPRRLVLGADTIVVLGDDVLGKPNDPEDAVRLLTMLVGRRHRVLTGIAIVDSESLHTISRCVESHVQMNPASEKDIRAYVATGESLDKAGAYALQGEGGRRFVARVEGSESNVIGLPLEETLALLEEARAARQEAP